MVRLKVEPGELLGKTIVMIKPPDVLRRQSSRPECPLLVRRSPIRAGIRGWRTAKRETCGGWRGPHGPQPAGCADHGRSRASPGGQARYDVILPTHQRGLHEQLVFGCCRSRGLAVIHGSAQIRPRHWRSSRSDDLPEHLQKLPDTWSSHR